MRIIDVHSHWGSRRDYPVQRKHELPQQRATWNSETLNHTAAEMAAYFRANGVRAILDLGHGKFRPIAEMRTLHDYALATEAAYPAVILGHWIHADPLRSGADGIRGLSGASTRSGASWDTPFRRHARSLPPSPP